MRQLRPGLQTVEQMLAVLAPQRTQGYRLLACRQANRPLALASHRKLDNLIHGSFLYVDDLITCSGEQGGAMGRIYWPRYAESRLNSGVDGWG